MARMKSQASRPHPEYANSNAQKTAIRTSFSKMAHMSDARASCFK
jgi:hypothetical protein